MSNVRTSTRIIHSAFKAKTLPAIEEKVSGTVPKEEVKESFRIKRKASESSPTTEAASEKKAKAVNLYDEFKQGDLLYGLDKSPRKKAIAKLEEMKFHHVYINTLNKNVVRMVVDKSKEDKKLDTEERRKHYAFLMQHRAYLTREGGKPIPALKDDPIVGAAFRRACKQKLIDRSEDRDYVAHVIMTGLNCERICDKAKTNLGVTNSEVRAAFRDYLRHGRTRHPKIKYYDENLISIDPPWEQPENKKYFEKYGEKVLAKDAAKITLRKR